MSFFILDFEGLRISPNNYLVKEFALFNIKTKESKCLFIKTPSRSKFSASTNATIDWLTNFYHKINWNYGQHKYKDILNLLNCSDQTTFLVKGSEKAEFIRRNTKATVINLDTLGCPKVVLLPQPDKNCTFKKHFNTEHCALRKVLAFGDWYLKWKESQEI